VLLETGNSNSKPLYNKIEKCRCCAVISLGSEIWYQWMHYYYQIDFCAFGLRKILVINSLKALSKRTTIHNLNHQLMFTHSITYQQHATFHLNLPLILQIQCSFIFSKHLSHSTKLNYFTIVSSSISFYCYEGIPLLCFLCFFHATTANLN